MEPVLRVEQSGQSLDLSFCGCYTLTLEVLVCVDRSLGLYFFLTSVLCPIPGAGHAEKASIAVHSFK